MKIKDIRAKPTEELKKQMSDAEMELVKLNAQVASGTTIKSPGKIRQLKRTRAKILTILKERESKNYG